MRGVRKYSFIVPIAIAFLLSFMTILSQPMGKIDRVWSDVILTSEKEPVSQKYLIVDITAQDMSQLDRAHLPRALLAQALTRLNEAGAKRVLLDLNLSDELTSINDGSLIEAMAGFGPNRLALPQSSAPKFTAHASLVDLGLLTDTDGWTRVVRTSDNNPATWLATGQLSKENVNIDLRYTPSTIERMSVGDIIEGHDMDVSDYLVIISPDPLIASSRVHLPLSDAADRSAVIVLGSESILSAHQNTIKKSWLANLSIALIFMTIGVMFSTFIQKARFVFLGGLIMSFAAVGLNLTMMRLWGGQGYPIMQFICFLIGLFVTISYRLRLFQMISGFLKGDLSPEEAWAWRAHEDSLFPVILLNAMGNIRRMNPAAEDIKTWLGDDSSNISQFKFRQGITNISLVGNNGLSRKFALEWPNNAVAIIVMKDITETTRKFNELQKSQSQALELADTYEQKKNHAEAVSQQKSNFLANMSHELRTPLNAINGFSDILNRELFGPLGDPRYKEFANNILISGQHLLSLINDILDLSKIEAGKMKLNIELVEINKLITQTLSIVNIRAADARLKLICENTNLPNIKADPRAIKQILLNLLTNAIKFTPEGGLVKLSVEVQSSTLVLRVSDTGMGITQEDIKRLAQPFEQVKNKHSQKGEGTGLGLSLSKSLVELHGGTFTIESVIGKGTMVTFTLPNSLVAQHIQAPPANQNISHPMPQTTPQHPVLTQVS